MFLTYQRAAADLPPPYWDCPGWCPEEKEAKETSCSQCPAKAQEDEMGEELERLLDERVGPRWRDWGKDILLEHVYKVSYLAETDDDGWTTTTARLVGIYKGQQSRIERTEDYNRRKAEKERRNG